ncbi:glycosyltransferase [Pedobacter agri]|uniref:glycosyltransferase n=1 Tax=Pedobacter agri TaxID=454586 RepID=UPI0027851747|nr:glycosyltransferase family 2 protein [Pedobacter agri]MDQ1141133.1 GT2 family glycosyltransferase [Pedobacter agri]
MDLISASIVLYNNNLNILKNTINCILLDYQNIQLFLIDNSGSNVLCCLAVDERIVYIHNPSNPGFGAAHNLAIKKAISNGSKFHFIVNPDIHFNKDVIGPMVNFMINNIDVGMMMPQVLNEDGTIQNLPKLLPKPTDILWRKFKKPTKLYNKFINIYELRFIAKNKIYNAPVLSGCFTLLNLEAIKDVGMYDDRYFMYFEDWDLSRRMHQKYKTIYFPSVSVYHGYESGANKSAKLFKIFIKSAFAYFNKWGWFLDKERNRVNKTALNQF